MLRDMVPVLFVHICVILVLTESRERWMTEKEKVEKKSRGLVERIMHLESQIPPDHSNSGRWDGGRVPIFVNN